MTIRETHPSAVSQNAISPGYAVALVLKRPIRDLTCYVGQVQASDQHGIRITLIDWLIGNFSGWDFFVPWDNVEAMLIATPEHDVASFGETAGAWQTALSAQEST